MDTKLQVNVDSRLAAEAEYVLKSLGLDMTTAINIFLKQVVATGSIPFSIKESEAQKEERKSFHALPNLQKLPSEKGEIHFEDEMIDMDVWYELEYNYDAFVVDGIEYCLIEHAYLTSEVMPYKCFVADAIDKYGNHYTLRWDILPGVDVNNIRDKSKCCDWDNPTAVEEGFRHTQHYGIL